MDINGETRVFTIMGDPIAHTLSPVMYNAAFLALNKNCIYVAFKVGGNGLQQAVNGLRALGVRGGNVTIPHKEKIITYLDSISEEARLIGAVNTLYRDTDDRLCGANTDGPGFIEMLRKKEPESLKMKSAVILGAGGSARAVAVSLVMAGIKEITLVNRAIEKAKVLADTLIKLGADVRCLNWNNPDLAAAVRESRLIVNTTPLGMEPRIEQMPALDPYWLSKNHLVVDLIYKPAETMLLAQAKKRGAKTMNGSGMLLEQAVLSFEIFSGSKAPVEVMTRELERWL